MAQAQRVQWGALRVGRQAEELAGAVVAQREDVRASSTRSRPLADGVQDRLVVVVHQGQFLASPGRGCSGGGGVRPGRCPAVPVPRPSRPASTPASSSLT